MGNMKEVKHPYIHRAKGVCGGEPIVRGTRFTVRAIVEYVLLSGMSPEEVVREWTHLNLAQVYDALSYYHDHKPEIDRLIRANRDEASRRKATDGDMRNTLEWLHNYQS
jgi:uncharacterized protein (DUF433 family)